MPASASMPHSTEQNGKAGNLHYMSGFGNEFSSEALPGALPIGRNNPRVCPLNLYAEQLSGTAFTAPRCTNRRSWLYRIRPSVTGTPFSRSQYPAPHLTADFSAAVVNPNQLRWHAFKIPADPVNFVEGLLTLCGAGSAGSKDGYAIHIYAASASMGASSLCNADGDMLIVPQQGTLLVKTEFGRLRVGPGEICVLQRGMRWSIDLEPGGGGARGYVLEVFCGHFELPELGPIGSNGLANARDFQSPVAWYEDREDDFKLLHKLEGQLFESRQRHSPFNVVAWHGNYVPYKYDLARFCPVNAVAFDHPDPSINTVLTVRSAIPGTSVADFVVFVPRYIVGDNTFRPPFYHRNVQNEFVAYVRGHHEFSDSAMPGGASLHPSMTPHGPDSSTFERARGATGPAAEAPVHTGADLLAFMFETHHTPRVTQAALASPVLDRDYYSCWAGLKDHFSAGGRAAAATNDTKSAASNGSHAVAAAPASAPVTAAQQEVPEQPSSKKRKL